MKEFVLQLTVPAEITIEAESIEDAKEKFTDMDENDIAKNATVFLDAAVLV